MSKPLARLRANLDFMPSPDPDRPGLLIRDVYRFSDATLIIPPALVECLRYFDGETTELDLRAELVRRFAAYRSRRRADVSRHHPVPPV